MALWRSFVKARNMQPKHRGRENRAKPTGTGGAHCDVPRTGGNVESMKKLIFALATSHKSKREIVCEAVALAREAGILKEQAGPECALADPREPQQLSLPFPPPLNHLPHSAMTADAVDERLHGFLRH
jgi:hypothetical protein